MDRNTANNVFKNSGIAHDFLKNGGAKYISAAGTTRVNPELSFYAAKAQTQGLPCHSGKAEFSKNGSQIMKNANKELMSGNRLSEAELSNIDADIAQKMVENAEKQIANNKVTEMLAQKKSALTY